MSGIQERPFLSTITSIAPNDASNEQVRDAFLSIVSDSNSKLDDPVAGTGGTLRQSLQKLADSGLSEDYEILMNCAAGSGAIARHAKDLLATKMAAAANDMPAIGIADTIRSMAQALVCQTSKILGFFNPAEQPELLLMAGTRLPDENDDSAIPPVVRDNIKVYDQNEWKPAWWNLARPDNNGVFSLASLKSVSGGIGEIPGKTRLISIPGDGSCMYRACLMSRLHDESWGISARKSKDDVYKMLDELGWNDQIKKSIDRALDVMQKELCMFTEDFVQSFDKDILFANTIGNQDFSLYSPVGIGDAMSKMPGLGEQYDNEILGVFADTIANYFLEAVQTPRIPDDLSQMGAKGAWLVNNDAHYDLLVSEDHFELPEPVHEQDAPDLAGR